VFSAGTATIYDRTDFGITFKLASVLAADEPGKAEFENMEPAEDALRRSVIDAHGWGHYHYGEASRDTAPRFLPTVAAMLSLHRSRDLKSSDQADSVLRWICERLLDDAELLPAEAAIASLVLTEYESTGARVAKYREARETATTRLSRWVRGRRQAIGEMTSYHYTVCESGGERNHYVFYPTDVVVALALLRAGNPSGVREYTLDVVQYVCGHVERHGGLPARATNRIATVDQMWALRLLSCFEQVARAAPQTLAPKVAQLVSANPTRKAVTASVLTLLGVAGTLIYWDEDLATVLRVTAASTAAVALAILGTALWTWLGGK
jgi:hypothetical protein